MSLSLCIKSPVQIFQVCDQFYFCVDGVANKITCPESLIFNPKTVRRSLHLILMPLHIDKTFATTKPLTRQYLFYHSTYILDLCKLERGAYFVWVIVWGNIKKIIVGRSTYMLLT